MFELDNSNGPGPGWETTSDRFLVFQLAGDRLVSQHQQPTRLRGLALLGNQQDTLLVRAGDDGILAVDLRDPHSPRTRSFMRTLAPPSDVNLTDNSAFVSAGHQGLLRLNLAPSPP